MTSQELLRWHLDAGVDETIAAKPVNRFESLAAEPDSYSEPRLSPDGTRLATKVEDEDGDWDIYVYDIARNNFTQLTFDDAPDCC
ncbi:MAG TPA: hypothetical protein EYO85_01120, partial [Rhodospirillales bacterium]|nr:hypothetical protein [Rhodospirillales bacterium]